MRLVWLRGSPWEYSLLPLPMGEVIPERRMLPVVVRNVGRGCVGVSRAVDPSPPRRDFPNRVPRNDKNRKQGKAVPGVPQNEDGVVCGGGGGGEVWGEPVGAGTDNRHCGGRYTFTPSALWDPRLSLFFVIAGIRREGPRVCVGCVCGFRGWPTSLAWPGPWGTGGWEGR